MIKAELTKRIKNAQYLSDDEKTSLFEQLPNLKQDDLAKLNDIFINTEYEHEALLQGNDFAVTGLMETYSAMNIVEFKDNENA